MEDLRISDLKELDLLKSISDNEESIAQKNIQTFRNKRLASLITDDSFLYKTISSLSAFISQSRILNIFSLQFF